MSRPSIPTFYAHLRGLAAARGEEIPGDRELVGRYLAGRDEAAFVALVHRHGPMVLETCRRLLPRAQDAEDAFQAAFLALALRARTIRSLDSVGGWLHGAAYRAARRVQLDALRRARRSGPLAEVPAPPARDELSWREVSAALDEELGRLPEHYRSPLVLCYLEGLTRDEAAQALGWTLTVLRGRLNRARERLRWRLARRGIELSGVLLTAAVAPRARAAVVPAGLALAAVRHAGEVGAGRSAVEAAGPQVGQLTQGVIQAMSATKGSLAAGAAAVLGVLGLSVGLAAQAPRGELGPPAGGATDARPATGPGEPGRGPAGEDSGGGQVPEKDLARRVQKLEAAMERLARSVERLTEELARVKGPAGPGPGDPGQGPPGGGQLGAFGGPQAGNFGQVGGQPGGALGGPPAGGAMGGPPAGGAMGGPPAGGAMGARGGPPQGGQMGGPPAANFGQVGGQSGGGQRGGVGGPLNQDQKDPLGKIREQQQELRRRLEELRQSGGREEQELRRRLEEAAALEKRLLDRQKQFQAEQEEILRELERLRQPGTQGRPKRDRDK